jgi:hypothetical protein
VTQHEHNMQLVEVDRIAEEIEYIREKHAEYAASIQAVFGSGELYRWLATQYRRAGRRRQATSSFLMTALRYRAPRDLLRGIAALAGDHNRFDRTRSRLGGGKVPQPRWVLTSGSINTGGEPTAQPRGVSP